MSSAYTSVAYFQNALQTNFVMEANTIKSDQTDPIEQSDLGSYCMQYRLQADERAEDNCQ